MEEGNQFNIHYQTEIMLTHIKNVTIFAYFYRFLRFDDQLTLNMNTSIQLPVSLALPVQD